MRTCLKVMRSSTLQLRPPARKRAATVSACSPHAAVRPSGFTACYVCVRGVRGRILIFSGRQPRSLRAHHTQLSGPPDVPHIQLYCLAAVLASHQWAELCVRISSPSAVKSHKCVPSFTRLAHLPSVFPSTGLSPFFATAKYTSTCEVNWRQTAVREHL